MTSKVQIISNAFINLGKGPITDLSTGNSIKSATIQVYDQLYLSVLQRRPWSFALTTQSLVQVASPDAIPGYTYAFQLPTDPLCIFIWGAYPYGTDFIRVGDYLYTNSSTLQILYTTNVDESLWDPAFVTYFIDALTSKIAYLITQETTISEEWNKKAEISRAYASSSDSRMQPNLPILDNKIYNAHFIG